MYIPVNPKRANGVGMKIGVLGTGTVGKTIATKLVSLGHEVGMGSRTNDNPAATTWAAETGTRASHGAYADVAEQAELVFNCTSGAGSLSAVRAAGADNLAGKVLVDVSNPLDFSHGMPPTLLVCNTDSLGEQLQRQLPATNVVKALHTVNALVMVEPGRVPGQHDVLICGDDEQAKIQVSEILRSFGWPERSIIDLGPISAARGTEMYLPLWLRLHGILGTGDFNISVVHR
jgi:predicted dinucleotide-binding enzyme